MARDAIRLRTRIEGGTSELLERNIETLGTNDDPVRFPVEAILLPLGGDATRRFRFEATAVDAAGQELGTVRTLSSFSSGRTGTIRLTLEDCCRSVRCAAEETCRGCGCVPAIIEPISEDASVGSDAHVSVDAHFTRDAPMSLDAGTDTFSSTRPGCTLSSSCIELTPAAIRREVDTMLGPLQCQRPIAGSCPSPAASSTYGCDVFRIYNPRAEAVQVNVQTDAPLVDTFLSLYREDSANLAVFPGPSSNPSPSLCVYAIDNTPGFASHESVTFSMPPGSVYRVVISTAAATDSGDATLIVNVL